MISKGLLQLKGDIESYKGNTKEAIRFYEHCIELIK